MIELIDIDDLNRPELKPFTHLNENQLRHYWEPYGGLFIGESPNVILRALDAGYEPVSVLMEQRFVKAYESGGEENGTGAASAVLRRLGNRNTEPAETGRMEEPEPSVQNRENGKPIPVYVSSLEVLSKITGYHLTRGVLCAFRRKPLPSVESVCRDARRIAVLENIENPTNVGAIFRSAAALGMDAVLLTSECADPLYRRAVRVSVGTVFQIPWTYLDLPEQHYTWMKTEKYRTNRAFFSGESGENASGESGGKAGPQISWPAQGMQLLQKLGFRTAAMALRDDTISLDDPALRKEERLALILGNEGEGLLPETIGLCDCTIRIPMLHGVDSLNVAAASAVAFWELGKSRSGGSAGAKESDPDGGKTVS